MPCAPAAGLPPFDLKALAKSMDRFLAQLANLGKSEHNSGLAMEVALSLTFVMILAFELARLQARRSLSRSFLECSLLALTPPVTGDHP